MNTKACKDNISLIENYEKAKADDFKGWVIHHRLETHKRNRKTGMIDIPRDSKEYISVGALKSFGLYFHRPANELIWMKFTDHNKLHHTGKYVSQRTRDLQGKLAKGRNPRFLKKVLEMYHSQNEITDWNAFQKYYKVHLKEG